MKKLFVLFVVAGLALSSCGSRAQEEEVVTEPVADTTVVEVADSTAAVEATEEAPAEVVE